MLILITVFLCLRQVSRVLGLSLLWSCFDPGQENRMLSASRNRIRLAYAELVGEPVGPETPNPVRRSTLLIMGDEDRLDIHDAYGEEEEEDGDQNPSDLSSRTTSTAGTGMAMQMVTQQVTSVNSNIREVRREVLELKQEIETLKNNLYQSLGYIRASMNKIARAPHRVGVPTLDRIATPRDNPTQGNAFLSQSPKNLHELWQEYEVGINGHKPARMFTANERGRVSKKYSRRNLVWQKIVDLCRLGHTHVIAIDKVYEKYGAECTVTQIVNKISAENGMNRPRPAADV